MKNQEKNNKGQVKNNGQSQSKNQGQTKNQVNKQQKPQQQPIKGSTDIKDQQKEKK